MPFNYHQPRNGHTCRFLGYLRVSKDDETTGSHTFQTQETRIRELLDRGCKEGRYELELFRDDGVSGALALSATLSQPKTRPTLRLIADKLRTGEYDGLVVYEQNRLFRNPRGMLEFVEDVLLPTKTALLSPNENLDISTSDGRVMISLKSILDGATRDQIVKRNRDAAAMAKQVGSYVGQVPFGWDWAPRQEWQAKVPGQRRGIVPIEEQRQWLMLIKKRYLAGHSAITIAGELNTLRVPPPSHQARWLKKAVVSPGALWKGTEVYSALACPTHAGLIRDPRLKEQAQSVSAPETEEEALWQRLAAKGYRRGQHFALRLWEPQEWEEICALHEKRIQVFRTITARPNNLQLLAGMLLCARCGKRLYGHKSTAKAQRTYACNNGHQAGMPTCRGLHVRADWVEAAVVKELHELAAQPQMRELIRREAEALLKEQSGQSAQEARQLSAALEELDRKFERWADALSDGTLSHDQFRAFNDKLSAQRRDLQERLETAQAALRAGRNAGEEARRVGEALEQIALAWEHLSPDEQRQLLFLLVEKLEADREERLIKLRIKVRLLPERDIVIPYTQFHGTKRSKADPITLLTRREMAILHLTAQGMTQTQIALHWGLKPDSLYTYAKAIRKKFGGRSLHEIEREAHGRIQLTLEFLPLAAKAKPSAQNSQAKVVNGEVVPFLSGVLMEVFPLFASGASVSDVAQRLDLSKITVQGRRDKILKLLGTSSMLEAVEKAKLWEILS